MGAWPIKSPRLLHCGSELAGRNGGGDWSLDCAMLYAPPTSVSALHERVAAFEFLACFFVFNANHDPENQLVLYGFK